jgi:hypothetical protein
MSPKTCGPFLLQFPTYMMGVSTVSLCGTIDMGFETVLQPLIHNCLHVDPPLVSIQIHWFQNVCTLKLASIIRIGSLACIPCSNSTG